MENEVLDRSELGLKVLKENNLGTGPIYGNLSVGKHFREFKIYGEVGENPDTVNFRKYMKEIEERINADLEIIEIVKKCNVEFAESLRARLAYPENDIFIGAMVADLQLSCKRYAYIKHLNFNGKEYEAEIDVLRRIFRLFEV